MDEDYKNRKEIFEKMVYERILIEIQKGQIYLNHNKCVLPICQKIPHIGSIFCIKHCQEENHGHCTSIGIIYDSMYGCNKTPIIGRKICEEH